jgi:hypothetical protein
MRVGATGIQRAGHPSKSVRGPLYWHTEGGQSIYNIWVRSRLDLAEAPAKSLP